MLEYTLDDAIQDVGNGAIDPDLLEAWLKELRRRREEKPGRKTPNENILLGKLGAMADDLGDGTWKGWTESQAHEVEGAIDEAMALFKEARERNHELTRRIYEALIDLGAPLPDKGKP